MIENMYEYLCRIDGIYGLDRFVMYSIICYHSLTLLYNKYIICEKRGGIF